MNNRVWSFTGKFLAFLHVEVSLVNNYKTVHRCLNVRYVDSLD